MQFFKRLSLRIRLASGLAAMILILAAVVFVTIDRVDRNLAQTEQMTRVQVPLLMAADQVVRGVEASTSALRGWVLLGEQAFAEQRQQAYAEQVLPGLDVLSRHLGGADAGQAERLAAVEQQLTALRALQDDIEATANQPANVPARQMFIDLRRQMLLALAETQSAVTRAVSSIRAFLLTGDERFTAGLDTHSSIYTVWWNKWRTMHRRMPMRRAARMPRPTPACRWSRRRGTPSSRCRNRWARPATRSSA
jgi:hypothetical protein